MTSDTGETTVSPPRQRAEDPETTSITDSSQHSTDQSALLRPTRAPLELSFGCSMHGVTARESLYAFGEKDYATRNGGSMVGLLEGGARGYSPIPVDSRGRPFVLPVDSEHKARQLRLLSFSRPHMTAFYLSIFGFFTSFMSTFSPAALISVLREDLGMTQHDVAVGNVAAVIGTIGSRIVLGSLCDALGPRVAMASTLLLTAPAAFCLALVTGPRAFFALRFLLGLSLGCFVPNQYWASAMFSPKVVGLANGLSAGLGNCGGGVTHLVMPFVYSELVRSAGLPNFVAWRYAMFLPGCLHIVAACLVLLWTEDCPDGNFSRLRATGQMNQASMAGTWRLVKYAISNYRTWVLVSAYACSFGIELTFDNLATVYFVDLFDLDVETAGYFGSLFGLMAIVMRPFGGFCSDFFAKRYGMRGRIWNLYLSNAIGCGLAMVMASQYASFPSTVVSLVFFSMAVIYATGSAYGVVPFVSKRALGVISGLVSAGGNAGASLWQFAFFSSAHITPHAALFFMGLTTLLLSTPVLLLYWPAWGGAFCPAQQAASEEQYFLHEYSLEEIQAGDATGALLFAAESRYQRNGEARSKNGSVEQGKDPSTRFASPARLNGFEDVSSSFPPSSCSADGSGLGNGNGHSSALSSPQKGPPAPSRSPKGAQDSASPAALDLPSASRGSSFQGFKSLPTVSRSASDLEEPDPSLRHPQLSALTLLEASRPPTLIPHALSSLPDPPTSTSPGDLLLGSISVFGGFSTRPLEVIRESEASSSVDGSETSSGALMRPGPAASTPTSPHRASSRPPLARNNSITGNNTTTRGSVPPSIRTSLSSPSLQSLELQHTSNNAYESSGFHPRVWIHAYNSSDEDEGSPRPSSSSGAPSAPRLSTEPRWSAPTGPVEPSTSPAPGSTAPAAAESSRLSSADLSAISSRRSLGPEGPAGGPSSSGRLSETARRAVIYSPASFNAPRRTAPLQILKPSESSVVTEGGDKCLVKRFSFQDLPMFTSVTPPSVSSSLGGGWNGLVAGRSSSSSKQQKAPSTSRLNRSSTNPRFATSSERGDGFGGSAASSGSVTPTAPSSLT